MDLTMTLLQLIKNDFSISDMDEMALYELEMFVIVVMADKERKLIDQGS